MLGSRAVGVKTAFEVERVSGAERSAALANERATVLKSAQR
jgi:hypothetical protein